MPLAIDWERLLLTLLSEHDDDVYGERLAVLDFCIVHERLTRGESE